MVPAGFTAALWKIPANRRIGWLVSRQGPSPPILGGGEGLSGPLTPHSHLDRAVGAAMNELLDVGVVGVVHSVG